MTNKHAFIIQLEERINNLFEDRKERLESASNRRDDSGYSADEVDEEWQEDHRQDFEKAKQSDMESAVQMLGEALAVREAIKKFKIDEHGLYEASDFGKLIGMKGFDETCLKVPFAKEIIAKNISGYAEPFLKGWNARKAKESEMLSGAPLKIRMAKDVAWSFAEKDDGWYAKLAIMAETYKLKTDFCVKKFKNDKKAGAL